MQNRGMTLSYSLIRSLDIIFTMVRRRHVSPANSMTKLRKPTCKPIYSRKYINKLFAGLGSVRIVKNCDLGLEGAR